jgi:NAD(P)-dependent dehydrogenase (short-subunit alcohol dehydrogenase family)
LIATGPKAAVNHLIRHVAVNGGRHNIRSNGAMSGLVMSETRERLKRTRSCGKSC